MISFWQTCQIFEKSTGVPTTKRNLVLFSLSKKLSLTLASVCVASVARRIERTTASSEKSPMLSALWDSEAASLHHPSSSWHCCYSTAAHYCCDICLFVRYFIHLVTAAASSDERRRLQALLKLIVLTVTVLVKDHHHRHHHHHHQVPGVVS